MIPFKMIEVPRDKWDSVRDGNSKADLLKVFKSDRFLVQVRMHNDVVRICVNKVKWTNVGGKPIWADGITWDELQEIKDQCGFRDTWLCEYYPPRDKIINVANIRHLWVLRCEPENSLDKQIKNE